VSSTLASRQAPYSPFARGPGLADFEARQQAPSGHCAAANILLPMIRYTMSLKGCSTLAAKG
jgi:hypothetical protein